MLRKIITFVVFVPLAVLIVAFAVANRHTVTASLDPFNSTSPAYAVTLPLFVILFVVTIAGVIVGGFASWLRQSSWRRTARQLDTEVRSLRDEISAMRSQLNSAGARPEAGREADLPPRLSPPQSPL